MNRKWIGIDVTDLAINQTNEGAGCLVPAAIADAVAVGTNHPASSGSKLGRSGTTRSTP